MGEGGQYNAVFEGGWCMKKTITIAAYNRPGLLRLLLKSLKHQLHSLADYRLYIRIDAGGERFERVKQVALAVDFMDREVSYPEQNEGINMNTYKLMEWVFEEEGADWNVYLEDDLLLSPDAFDLVEWYIKHSEEEEMGDIGAYCLCRLRESGDPEEVYLSRALVAWGFLMDRHQWETYAKPIWLEDEGMWDNRLANHIRSFEGVHNVFPGLSRVTNTGRRGAHFTVQKYDQLMQHHVYNQERKAYDYRLRDS